jgi:hypothetical protein
MFNSRLWTVLTSIEWPPAARAELVEDFDPLTLWELTSHLIWYNNAYQAYQLFLISLYI